MERRQRQRHPGPLLLLLLPLRARSKDEDEDETDECGRIETEVVVVDRVVEVIVNKSGNGEEQEAEREEVMDVLRQS